MAVPLIHRCGYCGYESEVSSALPTFSDNPFCRKCGLSASESDSKLQDELSNLISQHLTLSQPAVVDKQGTNTSPITYITQHYHHSGHIAPAVAPQSDEVSQQLSIHGIEASVLSPSQIHLFANAQPEQQARLIQLWQIAPPAHNERRAGYGPEASMEQEEEAARARYIKMTSPITLHQPTEPTTAHSAEPYIIHGYAASALADFSPSLDPVYQHQHDNHNQSREWWTHSTSPQPMEHQYGAVMQMRDFFEGRTAGSPQSATAGYGREENMW